MTTHTDLIARLREFGPCIAQDVQDALESLEQQVATMKAVAHLEKVRAENAEQQVAALRVDAERYQILRRGQHWSVINGVGDELRADQLDAAIDAAMGEK